MHFTLTDDFDAVKIAASGQCFRWYPLSDGRCRIFARNPIFRLSGGHLMHFTLTDDFDAVKIAASGQCFRWYPLSDGRCRIFARDRTVVLKQTAPDTLELDCTPEEFQSFWHDYFDFSTDYTAIRALIDPDCTPEEFQSFWHDYFDFSTDYTAIRALIDPDDHYLSQSAACGQGIRILRQDPFEMLITFLLSQRKSIPAIQKSVEALSRAAGTPIGEADGQTLYAFPTPAQLAALDDDTSCSRSASPSRPFRNRSRRCPVRRVRRSARPTVRHSMPVPPPHSWPPSMTILLPPAVWATVCPTSDRLHRLSHTIPVFLTSWPRGTMPRCAKNCSPCTVSAPKSPSA